MRKVAGGGAAHKGGVDIESDLFIQGVRVFVLGNFAVAKHGAQNYIATFLRQLGVDIGAVDVG